MTLGEVLVEFWLSCLVFVTFGADLRCQWTLSLSLSLSLLLSLSSNQTAGLEDLDDPDYAIGVSLSPFDLSF